MHTTRAAAAIRLPYLRPNLSPDLFSYLLLNLLLIVCLLLILSLYGARHDTAVKILLEERVHDQKR